MGIDIQGFRFLIKTQAIKQFGKTLTLGRQGLYISNDVIEVFTETPYPKFNQHTGSEYCEKLFLGYFGATEVDSIDASNYEGASILHDMNKPVVENLHNQYDTVFDGGTLEHVFNIKQAFENVSNMCKLGGQILHVLPANNQCGHGFYQFSPELFFSLYSEDNGYKDTEVEIGDPNNIQFYQKLEPPVNGQRHNIQYPSALYCFVRTVKSRPNFSHDKVYQSDYVHNWRST